MNGILNRLAELPHIENREVILKLLEQNSSAKLLDCGCNTGELTLELGRRIGTKQVYGIEVFEEYAKQAIENGVKVYPADLNSPLPIDSETFDVVHASHVIEHLHNTDGFIREIYRVLRRGSYAVVSTPNLASLPNILPLLLGTQPLHADVSSEVHVGTPFSFLHNRRFETRSQSHLRIFTYKALKELFQYHGFSVERITSVGFYPLPASLGKLACRILPRHGTHLVMKVRKP